jgi:hypothetical protein
VNLTHKLPLLGVTTFVVAGATLVLPGPAVHGPAVHRAAVEMAAAQRGANLPMQAPKTYISAVIIPTETYSIGNSLPSGPEGKSFGYALSANGIDGSYIAATSPRETFDFLFFVFSNNHSVTEDISFSVVSPSNTTVYQYRFKPAAVPAPGDWFTISATGNFEATGTYFAEVHAGSSLIGWIPLDFVS